MFLFRVEECSTSGLLYYAYGDLRCLSLKAQGKYEEADVRIKSIDHIHAQPLADESAEKVEKTQTNCILRLLILMYCAVRILKKIRITLMNVVLQPNFSK